MFCDTPSRLKRLSINFQLETNGNTRENMHFLQSALLFSASESRAFLCGYHQSTTSDTLSYHQAGECGGAHPSQQELKQ